MNKDFKSLEDTYGDVIQNEGLFDRIAANVQGKKAYLKQGLSNVKTAFKGGDKPLNIPSAARASEEARYKRLISKIGPKLEKSSDNISKALADFDTVLSEIDNDMISMDMDQGSNLKKNFDDMRAEFIQVNNIVQDKINKLLSNFKVASIPPPIPAAQNAPAATTAPAAASSQPADTSAHVDPEDAVRQQKYETDLSAKTQINTNDKVGWKSTTGRDVEGQVIQLIPPDKAQVKIGNTKSVVPLAKLVKKESIEPFKNFFMR